MEYKTANIIQEGLHDIKTKQNSIKPSCLHYDNNFLNIQRQWEKINDSVLPWKSGILDNFYFPFYAFFSYSKFFTMNRHHFCHKKYLEND